MVTQLLYGSEIRDKDVDNYIDRMEYKGKKYDSRVIIWWEVRYYQNNKYRLYRGPLSYAEEWFPAYNVYYDKDTGFIFYRKKSDANEQKRPCSARILYGQLYSTGRNEDIEIPVADAVNLLKEHPEYFEDSNNRPADIMWEKYREYDDTGRMIREYCD